MHARKSVLSPTPDARRWRALRLPAALVLCLSLACCSLTGAQSRSWTEDVALPGGGTVRISRHVEFTESRDLSGGAYSAPETKSTLQLPDAPVLQWSSPKVPVLLYRNAAGRWVVVVTTSSCTEWSSHGKPSPPHWQYELLGAAWREAPLSPESTGKLANLFFRYKDVVYRDIAHLTAEQKADIESAAPRRAYLQQVGQTENFNCR